MNALARTGSRFVVLGFLLALNVALPPLSLADCSDHELTAVMLVSRIYPGTELEFDLLYVTPVLEATYPSDEGLLEIVEAVYADDPMHVYYDHERVATVDEFHLYIAPPNDFGAVTIVDRRNGEVVFAATWVLMGTGHVVHPVTSSHSWTWEMGQPADLPVSLGVFPNSHWWEDQWGSLEEMAESALEIVSLTDVLHSFADCDDYRAVGYTYTPHIGITDPYVALQVLLISGRAEPPWGTVTGIAEPMVPEAISLAVHPNPFNPQTTIKFTLHQPQHAEIAVYDLTGKQIAVLADLAFDAGDYSVVWSGKDAMGRAVPSGTYVVRLETESCVEARKVMLLR